MARLIEGNQERLGEGGPLLLGAVPGSSGLPRCGSVRSSVVGPTVCNCCAVRDGRGSKPAATCQQDCVAGGLVSSVHNSWLDLQSRPGSVPWHVQPRRFFTFAIFTFAPPSR